MKIAIRALVLGMLITGFTADHMLSLKSASIAPSTAVVASDSASPVPNCEPGSTCGFNK